MTLRYEIVNDPDCSEPEMITRIGYLKSSRYCLGNVAMSGDELDALRDSGHLLVMPVFAYVHSGAMIRAAWKRESLGYPFNCPWDAGQSGAAWITKEDFRRVMMRKRITEKDRARAEEIIMQDVKLFSDWIAGECYGYRIFDGEEEVDSCYGFIGREYAEQEAREAMKLFESKECGECEKCEELNSAACPA